LTDAIQWSILICRKKGEIMSEFFCLGRSGAPLNDRICDLILNAAYNMIAEHSRKYRFSKRKHNLEGEVTTAYRRVSVGGIGGIVFLAKVTDHVLSTIATFVVSENAVAPRDHGPWHYRTSAFSPN
jgi:hypothetical protein